MIAESSKNFQQPSTATDDKDNVLSVLQDALHASNLLRKLYDFWICDHSNEIDSLKSYRQNSVIGLSEACLAKRALKEASEDFIERVPVFSHKDTLVMEELGLQSLLWKSTWLKIMVPGPPANFDKWLLQICYGKLLFIRDYQSTTLRSTKNLNEKPVKSIVNDDFDTKKIKSKWRPDIRLRCAATGYMAGLLSLFSIALLCAAFAPKSLEIVNSWSISNSMMYTTIWALIVVAFGVVSFQLINHSFTPSNFSTVSGSARTARSGGFVVLRASHRRIVGGCAGPLMHGIGAGISTSAGFGSFGAIVMIDGIHDTYQLPLWLSQWMVASSCFLIAWCWARIPLGVGTLPVLLLIGPALSFGATIAPQELGFIGNLIAFIVGTMVFSFGVALTAAAALGPDGQTALSLAAERANNWKIPHSSLFFAVITICIGIVLGGNFGVASIVNLMLVPVLLHYFIPPLRRYLLDDPGLRPNNGSHVRV